jgi:hypothetical protein
MSTVCSTASHACALAATPILYVYMYVQARLHDEFLQVLGQLCSSDKVAAVVAAAAWSKDSGRGAIDMSLSAAGNNSKPEAGTTGSISTAITASFTCIVLLLQQLIPVVLLLILILLSVLASLLPLPTFIVTVLTATVSFKLPILAPLLKKVILAVVLLLVLKYYW